ncbi:MAG: hypothetical protein IV088_13830 [Hydrogenophaga sp.]|uniref:hypothetical protein n=1 Tax=Hydrogenophaga sp. TaxID=1904254 RepID=UPI0025C258DD|nr:hypothetical protein [Hydrogenophaga sp.]MBT9551929.1 hypothetical protein [Hydrogenophaga sp.]
MKKMLKRLPGLRGLAAELHDLRIRRDSDLDDAFLTEAAERAPDVCGHSVVWPWIKEHIHRPVHAERTMPA